MLYRKIYKKLKTNALQGNLQEIENKCFTGNFSKNRKQILYRETKWNILKSYLLSFWNGGVSAADEERQLS